MAGSKLKLGIGECPNCRGTGTVWAIVDGGGWNPDSFWIEEDFVPCRSCKGTGEVTTFTRMKK